MSRGRKKDPWEVYSDQLDKLDNSTPSNFGINTEEDRRRKKMEASEAVTTGITGSGSKEKTEAKLENQDYLTLASPTTGKILDKLDQGGGAAAGMDSQMLAKDRRKDRLYASDGSAPTSSGATSQPSTSNSKQVQSQDSKVRHKDDGTIEIDTYEGNNVSGITKLGK